MWPVSCHLDAYRLGAGALVDLVMDLRHFAIQPSTVGMDPHRIARRDQGTSLGARRASTQRSDSSVISKSIRPASTTSPSTKASVTTVPLRGANRTKLPSASLGASLQQVIDLVLGHAEGNDPCLGLLATNLSFRGSASATTGVPATAPCRHSRSAMTRFPCASDISTLDRVTSG